MAGIDESREFVPLRIAILTVSDTRTEETDKSGAILKDRAQGAGHEVVDKRIVKDTQGQIESQLREWVKGGDVDVVLTTGGTGVTPRDVTPEAVEAVCEKLIPGFGELFRQLSYENIGTSTIQSRATAGCAKATYIFALPGSTGACKDGWEMILSSQLDSRYRPCNFAELLPRLRDEKAS
jgi:molybdenum cofactor biosynthesis protein B